MQKYDKKAFNSAKRRIKTAGTTIRECLQTIIEMGLSHFQETGDTCYLTTAIEVAQDTRTVPANKVKEYIKEHANVVWKKDKDKGERFKKAGDKVKVKVPKVTWYEFAQADKVHPDMDVKAQVKSLVARIQKNIEESHIKDGQQSFAEDMIATLNKKLA